MAILYTQETNTLLLDGGTIQQRQVTIDYELSIDYNSIDSNNNVDWFDEDCNIEE